MLIGILFLFINVNVFSQPQSEKIHKGINPENIDPGINPNVDFYLYSNGNWLRNNPIPPEYSRWGSWTEVIERNYIVLKEILEGSSRDNTVAKGTIPQKIGDLYFMAMDTVTIEKEGLNPLSEDLSIIEGINTQEDFVRVFSYLKSFRSGGLFGFFAGQDDKSSKDVILQLFQGGLGMPDKDYYLRDDEKSLKIKSQYQEFMTKIFQLMGNDVTTSMRTAQRIMDVETRLARVSMSRTEMREAEATYHKFTLDELKALMPNFTWNVLFNEIGIADERRFDKGINVGQPEFFKEVNRMIADVSLEDWKNYLKWNLVRNTSEMLSADFANESFNFYEKTLRGIEKKQPRWKKSLELVQNVLGEPLGKLFVERRFKPEAKAKALEMVANIKEAFGNRLMQNEWMSEITKKEALKKLSTFNVKIGYTDKWREYSGLEIDRSSFVNNMRRAAIFNTKYNLNKINLPVDPNEWFMFPHTVNASYSSSKNEIVFPAGIMQPPFYDPEADDAVNYGAIGAVIGHEITHGFDDQGRKFDADGNLKDWWTDEDAKKFKERADKLVKQYNGYLVIDTLHVNGELTLGENIADLGGLLVAYDALQKSLQGKDKPMIDGFTPEQRFFFGFSQVWKGNSRPEALRLQVNTDPHSPGKFRVIGTLSNIKAFMDAFNGKEGDPMINGQDKRVVIW